MKNLIIKISTSFVLAIILSVVSANAQEFRSYQAEIPFDFTIGKTTYKAGNYTINLKSVNQNAAILAVRKVNTRKVREIAVIFNGSRSQMDKTSLMFARYGDNRILSEIISQNFGLTVQKAKSKKKLAKNFGEPNETVSISLNDLIL